MRRCLLFLELWIGYGIKPSSMLYCYVIILMRLVLDPGVESGGHSYFCGFNRQWIRDLSVHLMSHQSNWKKKTRPRSSNKQLSLWKISNAYIKDFLFVYFRKNLKSETCTFCRLSSGHVWTRWYLFNNNRIVVLDQTKSGILCWEEIEDIFSQFCSILWKELNKRSEAKQLIKP